MKQSAQLELPYLSLIAVDAPLRDQRETMSYPFLSLSKSKRTTPIVFERTVKDKVNKTEKQIYVRIKPDQEFGMATIWDFDVMLFFASLINSKVESGEWDKYDPNNYPTKFIVPANNILSFCNRSKGIRGYELLRKAFYRLRTTRIDTNLQFSSVNGNDKTNKRRLEMKSWIGDFAIDDKEVRSLKTGRRRYMRSVYTVDLPSWFVQNVAHGKNVLSCDREYFNLKGGLQRWLYRLARQRVGNQSYIPPWNLKTFHAFSGVSGSVADFKYRLKKVITQTEFPDYGFALFTENGVDKVSMYKARIDPIKKLKKTAIDIELITQSPEYELPHHRN